MLVMPGEVGWIIKRYATDPTSGSLREADATSGSLRETDPTTGPSKRLFTALEI